MFWNWVRIALIQLVLHTQKCLNLLVTSWSLTIRDNWRLGMSSSIPSWRNNQFLNHNWSSAPRQRRVRRTWDSRPSLHHFHSKGHYSNEHLPQTGEEETLPKVMPDKQVDEIIQQDHRLVFIKDSSPISESSMSNYSSIEEASESSWSTTITASIAKPGKGSEQRNAGVDSQGTNLGWWNHPHWSWI